MAEIKGKNISLKQMSQKEMRALWRKLVAEYGGDYNEEKVDERYERSLNENSRYREVGIFTQTGEVIGEVIFAQIVNSEYRCDLEMIFTSKEYTQKGFPAEAVLLAKSYAKDKLGLRRMYYDVSSKNVSLCATLKECGFQHTKTFASDYPDGSDRLTYFAML